MNSEFSRLSIESGNVHQDGRAAEFRLLNKLHFAFDGRWEAVAEPVLNHRFVSMIVCDPDWYDKIKIISPRNRKKNSYGVQAIRLPRCLGELSSMITMDLPTIDWGPDSGKLESVKSRWVTLTPDARPATTNRPCLLVRSPTMQRRWLSVLQSLAIFCVTCNILNKRCFKRVSNAKYYSFENTL